MIIEMFEDIATDIRFSLRRLFADSISSASALVTLALGIGANATVFGITYQTLIRPLPYPESTRLVAIWEDNVEEGLRRFRVSPLNLADWQKESRSFEALAGIAPRRMNLADSGDPEIIGVAKVSGSFWHVFKTPPLEGRVFNTEENGQMAVISHRMWHHRYAASPEVIGQLITLDARRYSLIGVMPEGFNAPDGIDVWIPLTSDPASENRGSRFLNVIGRIKPGLPFERAKTELTHIASILEKEHPDTNEGWSIDLASLHESTSADLRPSLLLLSSAVAAVLLMACINVSNLLLVQLLGRETEIAIRMAMGVSRSRLIRQLITEGVVLGLLGGLLSLAISILGSRLLKILLPVAVLKNHNSPLGETLLLSLIISLISGTFAGLLPAMQTLRQQHYESLRQGNISTNPRGSRIRTALVTSEISLAVALLICSGFLIRSLHNLRSTNPGFEPQGVITLRLILPEIKYTDPAMNSSFYRDLLDRLSGLPGVEGASAGFPLPLDGTAFFLFYGLPGETSGDTDMRSATVFTVSPEFFKTLAIPVIRGRVFTTSDMPTTTPVVVVSRTVAEREWPDAEPIGKRLTFDEPTNPRAVWYSVIGVVGDVRHKSLAESADGALYRSQFQTPTRNAVLILRTSSDRLPLMNSLREEIHAIDPHLAVTQLKPMTEIVDDSTEQALFRGWLSTIFAALALVLAAVGVYGVASHSANQRVHEVGIRTALGAQHWDIVALMMRHNARTILIGSALGTVLAALTLHLFSSVIYGIAPFDPLTFAVGNSAVAVISMFTITLPALRILKTDPATAISGSNYRYRSEERGR
jgi:predicted permease